MSLPAIQVDQVADDTQNRVNQSIKQFCYSLGKIPFLDGVWLPAQSFKGKTTITINHGLGRAFQSYLIGNVSAQVMISNSTPQAMDKTKQLSLTSSGDCTFDLWVF